MLCKTNKKLFSTNTLSYLFNKNIKDYKTPAFKFYSSQIEILSTPSEFYLSLIVSI